MPVKYSIGTHFNHFRNSWKEIGPSLSLHCSSFILRLSCRKLYNSSLFSISLLSESYLSRLLRTISGVCFPKYERCQMIGLSPNLYLLLLLWLKWSYLKRFGFLYRWKAKTDKSFELDFRIDLKLMRYPFLPDAMISWKCMRNTKQIVVSSYFGKEI